MPSWYHYDSIADTLNRRQRLAAALGLWFTELPFITITFVHSVEGKSSGWCTRWILTRTKNRDKDTVTFRYCPRRFENEQEGINKFSISKRTVFFFLKFKSKLQKQFQSDQIRELNLVQLARVFRYIDCSYGRHFMIPHLMVCKQIVEVDSQFDNRDGHVGRCVIRLTHASIFPIGKEKTLWKYKCHI